MGLFDSDVIDGGRRRYYSVRLIALCCALATLVSGTVGFGAGILLQNSLKDDIYEERVEACDRGNESRGESNQRVATHEKDAANLAKLARRLSKTRAQERAAFAAIGQEFGISAQVDPLLDSLQAASAADKAIAADQATITFDKLPERNCENVERP